MLFKVHPPPLDAALVLKSLETLALNKMQATNLNASDGTPTFTGSSSS